MKKGLCGCGASEKDQSLKRKGTFEENGGLGELTGGRIALRRLSCLPAITLCLFVILPIVVIPPHRLLVAAPHPSFHPLPPELTPPVLSLSHL